LCSYSAEQVGAGGAASTLVAAPSIAIADPGLGLFDLSVLTDPNDFSGLADGDDPFGLYSGVVAQN
jgi:hypothetical protein